mgnify:CR=1 FL=1
MERGESHLDMNKDVSWANGNGMALAIERKEINGNINTSFIIAQSCHQQRQANRSSHGKFPFSPFNRFGETNYHFFSRSGGQQIDVDVYTDPMSGKSYLYWGNGYMAGAELNDDMMSVKEETITVMTPKGGT